MNSMTCSTAVGVFASRDKAEAAITDLRDAGFTESQIGYVTRNADGTTVSKTKADAENAGEGATVGAITGAGVGALVGLGVLAGVVPVVGPALFAGTLGVLASNAAGGAAVVGVIGALTGWGVPEEDARYYESEAAAGRFVVTVTAGARCAEARTILRTHGAVSRDPEFAVAAR